MGHLIKKSILYELAFPSLSQFLFSLPYQKPPMSSASLTTPRRLTRPLLLRRTMGAARELRPAVCKRTTRPSGTPPSRLRSH
jgi:hypothetical protein